MANMEIGIHHATGAYLQSHYRDNSRHFSLIVTRNSEDGGDVEFSIFGMPEHLVDKIIDAFGMPKRFDFKSAQIYPEDVEMLNKRIADLEEKLEAAMARGEREAV